MADNVEERRTSVKGNIWRGVRCSYNENFKIMVIKHEEQTTVKQQGSTVSPKQTSKGGNNRNKNLFCMKLIQWHKKWWLACSWKKGCSFCMHSKLEWNTCFMWHLYNQSVRNWKMLPVNIVYQEFKASRRWCILKIQRNGICLWWRNTLCQKLMSDIYEEVLAFQKSVIGLEKQMITYQSK
jgi:hypothetical protein